MFKISACIEGGYHDPNVICAFDPNKVVARLRGLFPNLEVDPQDYAWREFDLFTSHGIVDESGALGVAVRDARRRGPVWRFRVPFGTGESVGGWAERHYFGLLSDSPFPEPLRSQLVDFVEGLRFAACVSVKCVRIEGNEEYPA